MRKYLFSVLAILLFAGVARAEFIYDPKTEAPYKSVPVYNNSGSALDVGDVVVWDVISSTGDNDAYVTTTTTADTNIVAGVVYPAAIAAAESGTIVIYGLATCDINAAGAGDGTVLCTSSTAGAGKVCGTAAHKYAQMLTATTASGNGNCFVNP